MNIDLRICLNSSSNNHHICKTICIAKVSLFEYVFSQTYLGCWNFHHKLSFWNTQLKVPIEQQTLDPQCNIYLLNESMKFINIYYVISIIIRCWGFVYHITLLINYTLWITCIFSVLIQSLSSNCLVSYSHFTQPPQPHHLIKQGGNRRLSYDIIIFPLFLPML